MKILKKGFVITILAILATGVFSACCKDKNKVVFSDIYLNNQVITQYSEAEKLFTLPQGVYVYYSSSGGSNNYSDAYLEDFGGFLVMQSRIVGGAKKTFYGVWGVDGNMKVPVDYVNYYAVYDKIAVQDAAGNCYVYSSDGKVILKTITDAEGYVSIVNADGAAVVPASKFTAEHAKDVFYPISNDYIAVRSNIGFSAIADSDGKIIVSELKGKPSVFKAVDDYLVRSVTENNIKTVSIYDLSNNGKQLPKGSFTASSASATLSVVYLGDDNFYCYDAYKGTESDYDFTNLKGEYYKASLWMYNAKDDSVSYLSGSVIYSTVINDYYLAESDLPVDKYLKHGYSYVSVAMVKQKDKSTLYDQFIINSSGEAVVSMLDTLGGDIDYDTQGESYRDVLLTYVGEIGFSSSTSGDLRLYDKDGNIVLSKGDAEYSDVFYNGGVVVACKTVDGVSYYVAMDLSGKEIVSYDRKYTAMTPYIGEYAIAEYTDLNGTKQCVVLDKSGTSVSGDVYYSGSAAKRSYFYKDGIYITKTVTSQKYQLKNFSGDRIDVPEADNVVIVQYGISDLFYYTINTVQYSDGTSDKQYEVYRVK